jgi:N-acetylglutamate synthase-like GNAT family acetyltransferase
MVKQFQTNKDLQAEYKSQMAGNKPTVRSDINHTDGRDANPDCDFGEHELAQKMKKEVRISTGRSFGDESFSSPGFGADDGKEEDKAPIRTIFGDQSFEMDAGSLKGSSVSFRFATLGDEQHIAQVVNSAYNAVEKGDTGEAFRNTDEVTSAEQVADAIPDPDLKWYVAESDKEGIIAVAMFSMMPVGAIRMFAVAPQQQQTNVGKKLLKRLEDFLRINKQMLLYVCIPDHRVTAHAWIARRGFEPAGEAEFPPEMASILTRPTRLLTFKKNVRHVNAAGTAGAAAAGQQQKKKKRYQLKLSLSEPACQTIQPKVNLVGATVGSRLREADSQEQQLVDLVRGAPVKIDGKVRTLKRMIDPTAQPMMTDGSLDWNGGEGDGEDYDPRVTTDDCMMHSVRDSVPGSVVDQPTMD